MNVTGPSSNLSHLFEASVQGVTRAVQQANDDSDRLSDSEINGDIDIDALVDLNSAAVMVKVNVAALRTGDEMIGSLLNIKA